MGVRPAEPVSALSTKPNANGNVTHEEQPGRYTTGVGSTNQGGRTMRVRVLALMAASAVAASPLAVAVTGATAATKAKAGQSCKKGKKAPTGFTCKKNSKGKYVLAKK
jgi:hypothetical protein